MKKYLLVAVGLLLGATGYAQIGYQGQSAMCLGAAKTNCGYMANIRYLNHLRTQTVLGGEFLYNLEQLRATEDDRFNVQQYLAGVVYQYPVMFGRFGLLPSASALVGGEFADKMTKNGNLLQFHHRVLFGLSVNLPVEFVIGRRVAIYADPRILYLPNSNFEKCVFSVGLGLKCYF